MTNIVKEKRKEKGLTQAELAKKAGFSRQTIINIEHGHKTYNHYWTMKCIADALGYDVEDIFFF